MASISPTHQRVAGFDCDFLALGLATSDAEATPMLDADAEVLAENQHFHDFVGQLRVCDCGVSRREYLRSSDKEICSAVFDALFDPLPLLEG